MATDAIDLPSGLDLHQARKLFPGKVLGLDSHRDRPDVSIVIPALNEEGTLLRTLRSVTRSACRNVLDHGQSFEVVVIDNGSEDRTNEIASTFGARVVHEPVRGYASVRNAGIRAAVAPIILWTDADTQVGNRWVRSHMKHYEEDENVIAVSGSHELEGVHWTYPIVRKIRALIKGKSSWEGAGFNVSYRKEAAVAVGGYTKETSEDSVIWKALKEHAKKEGKRVVYDENDLDMRVRPSGRRFGTFSRVFSEVLRDVRHTFFGEESAPPKARRD